MAARSMIPCAKCAGLAMFEVAMDLTQVASYQVWVVTFVLLPFHWPCSTSVLTYYLWKKQKVFAVHLSHWEVGHKAEQVSDFACTSCTSARIKCCPDWHGLHFFNPTWPSALQKVWNWRVGIAPTHAQCIGSIWASLLLESLKEIERADAFPKCMSSSSLEPNRTEGLDCFLWGARSKIKKGSARHRKTLCTQYWGEKMGRPNSHFSGSDEGTEQNFPSICSWMIATVLSVTVLRRIDWRAGIVGVGSGDALKAA